tara:strand:+ start:4756 stop:5262 length:507 start_codon:yes stop_codon:yes gene_type:complete
VGWKTFKERFGIKHIVCVDGGNINIGSGYVNDLVKISIESGFVRENETFERFLKENYPKLREASQSEILSVIQERDVFGKSITVYTYDDEGIYTKQCEELGYPNVTHCGMLMYENKFSTDAEKVKAWFLDNIDIAIKWEQEHIEKLQREIAESRVALEKYKQSREKYS